MEVNKKLLPIKGHYFFFNAGTAPLVPYLSTYARQLGFTSATVGLVYTVLPLFGLIAKPLFGVIADKFKIHKFVFLTCQVISLLTFAGIYFIPETPTKTSVELQCGSSISNIKTCFQEDAGFDKCKVTSMEDENSTTTCKMNCEMKSPQMWQTVCEHWHIPEFCYSYSTDIKIAANITELVEDEPCVYLDSSGVIIDDVEYQPHCNSKLDFTVINGPCLVRCDDTVLNNFVGRNEINITCNVDTLSLRLCTYDRKTLTQLHNYTYYDGSYGICMMSCDLDSAAVLMQICEDLGAGKSKPCQPQLGVTLPSNFSFEATLMLAKIMLERNCVYMDIEHIKLPDSTIHYPVCEERQRQGSGVILKNFESNCEIECDNAVVNEIITSASDSKRNETQFTKQFWIFFALMIINWIGQAVVVTFGDAICFNTLGDNIELYGRQRLWGSVGWGIISLLTGALIDLFSNGSYKNYTVAFMMMAVFMLGDIAVSCYVKVEISKVSVNILGDIGTLLYSVQTFTFVIWTIAVGLCTGLVWQFLFWHIEDIIGLTCVGSNHVKTLQGLVSAIQTFGGEIPFMFVSGYLLKKIGHVNMMSLVLFAFGIRFLLYSSLTNAWWILPIELFQGITFGMFYPTLTSYASAVSPAGTETTVQGLVGAVFEGVGSSLGSFIGGKLYDSYGGWKTFQWFGYGALVLCGVHIVAQCFLKKRDNGGMLQGLSNIVRYRHGVEGDEVHVMSDLDDCHRCRLELY